MTRASFKFLIKPFIFLVMILGMPGIVFSQVAYQYEIIARTGTTIIDPNPGGGGNLGTIDALGKGPSINDAGKVAFIASSAGDVRILLKNNGGGYDKNFMIPPIKSISNDMQVNENGQISFRLFDNRAGEPTYLDSEVIRLDTVTGSNPVIGLGSDWFTATPFNFVNDWASLNNNGRVMFNANLKASQGGGTVLAADDDFIGPGPDEQSASLSTPSDLIPTLADNNLTAVRWGGTESDSFYVFTNRAMTSALIVAAQPEYNRIGQRPGISDDGRVAVYMGEHSTLGNSIFMVFLEGQNIKFRVMPIGAGTDINQRVAVNRISKDNANDYRVVYTSNNTSGQLGLYSIDVNVSTPLIPVVSNQTLLFEQGGTIGNFVVTVQDIDLFDAVNNNGEITAWAQTTVGTQVIIKANPNVNEIDKWWTTLNDAPSVEQSLPVTWTVSIDSPSGEDNYNFQIVFESLFAKWKVISTTQAQVTVSGGTLTSPINTNLIQSSFDLAVAPIGQLDPGVYTFTVTGFKVPSIAVVEKVRFQLLNNQQVGLPVVHRKLNALFVADHPALAILTPDSLNPINVKIPQDATPTIINTMEELVDQFAPILKFDNGVAAGTGPERFTQPFNAQTVFNNGNFFNGNDTGSSTQAMDLSFFANNDNITPAIGPMIYGSVLRKSDLIALNMLSSDGKPDEIAINYWFHYPRSNWREHGGFNDHEGDWEGVTVFLQWNAAGGYFEPDRVAFSQHTKLFYGIGGNFLKTDGGEKVDWSSLSLDALGNNFRHVVFVGLGGHASYYFTGKTDYATGSEYHLGNLSTFTALTNQSQGIDPIGSLSLANWQVFPGHWGKIGLAGNPPLAGSNGPEGPAFLDGGFGYGKRWLNPWAWARGFNPIKAPQKALPIGNILLIGNTARLTEASDAALIWQAEEFSSLAQFVQMDFQFTQLGDGDSLEINIGGTNVASFLFTNFPLGQYQSTGPIDISSFAGQTADLEVRLRSVGALNAQALIKDLTIINPDFADLVIDANSYLSKTYVRGESLPMTTTVRNQGTFEIISSQDYDVGVYLSTDNMWDAADRLIHTQTVTGVLPSSATELLNLAVVIPADMLVGNYYVIARVDEGSQILEMDETNNIFVSAAADVSIAQDTTQPLPIVTLTATPPAITRGETLSLSWTVTDAVSCTASGDWSGAKNSSGGSEGLVSLINSNYALDCSGLGGDSSGTVAVVVTNNPPVLSTISAPTIGEGSLLSLPITATDTVGETLILTAQLLDGSSLSTIGAFLADNGDGTATFSWSPGYTQAGNYNIVFDVSDGLLNDSQTVIVTVNNVIVPPPTVSLSTNVSSIEAGQPFQVTIGGSSSVGLASVWWFIEDVNNRVFHTIPGSVDGVAVNLAAAQQFGAGYGSTSYSMTHTVIIDEIGDYEVKANARDLLYPNEGEAHQASEGLGIPVVPVNVAPVIAAINNQVVTTGESLSFAVSAQDVQGDALTLNVAQTTVPDASFSASPTTVLADGSSTIEGEFRWVPTKDQLGTYMVSFKASDDRGAQLISDPVEIKVIPKNHRPRIHFFRNIGNRWLVWLGYDKEDRRNLQYSYRIDKGEWSTLSRRRWISVKSLNLTKGRHFFEVYAVDQQRLKSKIRRKRLRIR